jgi:ABC-type antimicrobial peptide transport system permease subunit
MNSYDLGVDRENLCLAKNSERPGLNDESLRNDLLTIPGVEAVSFTNCIPTRGARVTNEVTWPGKDETKKLHFWTISTDYDFNRTVNINMVSGRFFDRSFLSDSGSYVINDIAAEVMSLGDPVGKQITVDGKKGTITGVFTGFHTVDLRGPFTPTVISVGRDEKTDILIKFSGVTFSELRDKAGEVFRKYDPEMQFMPVLFSDLPDITGLKRISILLELAFLIALLLACLGLFGLASFTAEWRSREIGIRKVSGATSLSVLILLLKKYASWLLVSFLIALPLAFLAGRLYLEGFYFHAPMAWWAFVAGPAMALAVAVSAVLLKSWKLASGNPVDSLRYD